jgi:Phosphate-selective porin O and P
MHKLVPAAIALALVLPVGALADTSSDIASLRQEMDSMRAAYEARLQALEQRLQRAEAAITPPAPSVAAAAAPRAVVASGPAVTAATPTAPASAAPVVAPVLAEAAPATPQVASAGGGANAFNPSVSLILSGLYTRTSQDPARYAITGWQLPAGLQVGPSTRGFSLAETELALAASVDPWLRGAANISLAPDDKVSVEEAYVQTTSLGEGFSLKAGRFFSNVGYLNAQHSHTWDFVDNPLAYQALLGTQYGDDGLQLTWLPPLDQYVELGAEVGRGRSFPGSDSGRNGAGMTALTAHAGGDIGASQSWRAGLSMLNAKADDQLLLATNAAGGAVTDLFNGRTRVWIADAIWKWAPNGNATRTSFKLQGEYLRSTRTGNLVYDIGNTDRPGAYRAAPSGWYVQGVYQFMPSWRVGLRTEGLDAGTPDYGPNAASFAGGGFKPRKNTLMIDFNPSEFSRVRLQLAQDRAREGITDNQLFLQYQMSLGAHGAHSY